MNKKELIDEISLAAGISKMEAKKALTSILQNIETTLKNGEKVTLIGFGSWQVSNRGARNFRNPQTGKSIRVQSKNIIKFKPSQKLISKKNDDTGDGGPRSK